MIARVLLLFVLLTGTAGAQVGSGAQAIPGGTGLSVPLPKPSARDLEIQRRQEEYARKTDEEREAKERAAYRNSPQGADHCRRVEQDVRDAQQGFLREQRGTRQMDAAEQREMVEALTAQRDRICR
jgi:hypothetical protein